MNTIDQSKDPLKNRQILADRVLAFNAHNGPRVGDYLKLPQHSSKWGEFTRFTHDWGDSLQTGGEYYGSYYIATNGALSYSGGLYPGLAKADLLETDERKLGSVWFFDQNISGAGRGVCADIEFRVFHLKEGANTDGLWELTHDPIYKA